MPNDQKAYKVNHVSVAGVSMYQVGLVDFEGNPSGEMRHVGITLSWTGSPGFGELYITDRGSRGVHIDAEGLPKEFVKAVLSKLVDDAEFRRFPRCSFCKKCHTSLRSGGYYCPSCAPKEDDEPPEAYETAMPDILEATRSLLEAAKQATTIEDLDQALTKLKVALEPLGT